MKKLMIAAALVAAASFANAAVVIWDAGAVKDSTGADVGSAGVIKEYLWEVSAADYATLSAMDSATLSQTIGTAFKDGKMADLGLEKLTADGSAENGWTKRGGASLGVEGTIDHAANTTAYGLILFQDTAAEDMYMVNVASKLVEGAADVTVADLMTYRGGIDGGTATAWAKAGDVPEPTSAMLLLLGVAGLALRRRRA